MATKVDENRVRRAAERQGLTLIKSRRRDPLALDYGTFSIVERGTHKVLVLNASLDECERWLTTPRQRRAR